MTTFLKSIIITFLPLGVTLFFSKSAVHFGTDPTEHQSTGDSAMSWSESKINLLHNHVIHSCEMLTMPQTLSNRPLLSRMALLSCCILYNMDSGINICVDHCSY